MTTEDVSLAEYEARQFPQPHPVCAFGPQVVFSAIGEKRYWLLLVNAPADTVIICEYDSWQEWQQEMAVLRRAAQNGGPDAPPFAGVPANLPPSPPAAPAAYALSLFSLQM